MRNKDVLHPASIPARLGMAVFGNVEDRIGNNLPILLRGLDIAEHMGRVAVWNRNMSLRMAQPFDASVHAPPIIEKQ